MSKGVNGVIVCQKSRGWVETTEATLKSALTDLLNLEVLEVDVRGQRAMVIFSHAEYANLAIKLLDGKVVHGFPGVPNGTYLTARILIRGVEVEEVFNLFLNFRAIRPIPGVGVVEANGAKLRKIATAKSIFCELYLEGLSKPVLVTSNTTRLTTLLAVTLPSLTLCHCLQLACFRNARVGRRDANRIRGHYEDDSAERSRISVAGRRNRAGRKAGHRSTDGGSNQPGPPVTQQSARGSASSQAGNRPTVQPVPQNRAVGMGIIKFTAPPTFSGKQGEDAADW
uniref:Uncharacterized protein n=1 Tax=Daphnia galeata TaxID=27404 RepID=A0A8J2RGG6_9CRUS|nr:unnamed protein product [Daphnia galeata]